MDSENEWTSTSRIDDFEKGLKAMEMKDFAAAVQNFQSCMKKLSNQGLGLTSDLFPKCLQNISSCYNEIDDMEKALSFKKFEKLYYETVLLHDGLEGLVMKSRDSSDVETRRHAGDGSSEPSSQEYMSASTDENGDFRGNQTGKRAMEYQQLAKLCLQHECISLALEYSGKATLLCRHQYGDDNEKTKKAFELFTATYAEVGKKQYSDSMQSVNLETDEVALSSPAVVEETLLRHRKNVSKLKDKPEEGGRKLKPLKRTRSILKTKNSSNGLMQSNGGQRPPESPRRVTFADPLPQMVRLRDEDEHDNTSTSLLLFVLICILIILVSLLASSLFCHLNPEWNFCAEFRREIAYYHTKLRLLYRTYVR